MSSPRSFVRRAARTRALLAVALLAPAVPIATIASISLVTTLAPMAVVALIVGGCASADDGHASAHAADAAPRGAPTREAAHELQYTEVSEIRFGKDLVGYLVNVLPVPAGIEDKRPWQPGTALIQDTELLFIGFISPRGTTYKFDADGEARGVGFGSRDAGIAAFFKRNGPPTLVAVTAAPASGR